MNLPTPQVPDYSFQVTPKGTPIRDELHMNEEMEMRDSVKLKRARQADMRRNLRLGLTDLSHPKNEYMLNVQPVPVDDEKPEEKMEDDMSDRIAQVKAEKEEAKLLCVAIGHDDEDIDKFVELHKTCLNDVMYFPTHDVYGLSSNAGNMEKLTALQNEFDAMKKRMDDGTKKALRSEQKIKLLTNRYKMRAAKIWSQVEATFKHMETAEIEYKCLKALKRQEHLAASNRISNIREDVQKQKELEKTLQNRYGDLFVEQERIHSQTEK
ncbi:cell division cycle 5-like protein [Tanacetum coccineum]